MSSIISSLGIGSGIDVTSLVDQLVEVERSAPDNRLDSRQEKLETQISAYGQLSSSLSEFQSALSTIGSSDTFNSRAVSFPDTDILTPNSLDADAQVGDYQIEVTSIAAAQSLASPEFTDTDTPLGEGDLTIRFGSWTSYTSGGGPVGFTQNGDEAALTVSLSATDTLSDLADKINEQDSDLQASVVNTGSGYKLLLTAPSGSDTAIEIDADAALSQFAFKEGDFSMEQTQEASDAELKINGLSVTRPSNEVDDLITGLSFTINKASVGETVNFSISEENDTAQTAVEDFVDAYNTLYESMKSLTGIEIDEEDALVGSLSADGSAKSILSQIRSALTSSIPGLDDSGFSALTNLGIRTELDGTLSIDEDDFADAFENNFDDIANLFTRQASASNSAVSVGFGTYAAEAVAGTYEVVVTNEPEQGYANANAITAGFPLSTGSGSSYSFEVTVDGTTSQTITLPDNTNYADEDALATELQALINGDENISGVNASVSVSYNSTDSRFEFVSASYGEVSKVSFSSASTAMADIGITDAITGVAGEDAAGTIDGVTAFGSGNVLLPDVDSDLYGINLTVGSGSLGTSTITFSQGLAGELDTLIESILSTTGTIETRTETMTGQLESIENDREELDTRMELFEARLLAQFTAMEAVISSLQTSGDQVSTLLDTLPFTASSS
ncbi:MAG: flagellar filament capping protein FliD [Pontibacterium sp.]